MGICGFVHLDGIHTCKHSTLQHPVGCREPKQRVAVAQYHGFCSLTAKQWSALACLQSLTYHKFLMRDKEKGQGVSPPGSNGEERRREERKEGWGSTPSSGEVHITMHPLAPLASQSNI